MKFAPWYSRFPERLMQEKNAYSDNSLDFRLDEKLLENHGAVVFEGELQVAGENCVMQVVYPSGFPYVRPEVVVNSVLLSRHQNPYEGNLCLLPNEESAWQETDTGVLMVRQAIALLETYQQGIDAVAAREVDAPEPRSVWYPYTPGTSFILLDQPPETRPDEFGDFRFVLTASGLNIPQAVLTEMHFVSNIKGTPNRPTWQLLASQVPRNSGDVFTGTWMRVSAPPPFLKTDSGQRAGYAEYLKWARDQERKLSSRLALQSKKQNGVEVFALVYSDEGPTRGQYHDNWLVGVQFAAQPALSQPQLRSFLLRPFLWTQADQTSRQPSLRRLNDKKVLIVGLGALGSPLAAQLARAGVGQLGFVDPDYVDAGPLVRQDFDLHDIGLLKVEAAALRAQRINPRIAVECFPSLLGSANADLNHLEESVDSLAAFAESARNYDLLISTTGNRAVDLMLNEIGAILKKPCLFTWVLNGAWGGRAFRALPGHACYECFMHSWEQFGQPEKDPSDAPLYARGCGFPTFTGTGFDATAVAGLAARLSIQTLLAEETDAYPGSQANLINWSSRGAEMGSFPAIEHHNVLQQKQCRICQKQNR